MGLVYFSAVLPFSCSSGRSDKGVSCQSYAHVSLDCGFPGAVISAAGCRGLLACGIAPGLAVAELDHQLATIDKFPDQYPGVGGAAGGSLRGGDRGVLLLLTPFARPKAPPPSRCAGGERRVRLLGTLSDVGFDTLHGNFHGCDAVPQAGLVCQGPLQIQVTL